MDNEIADTKTTAKPGKQKKVDTNKRNKKAGDQEGDKKTQKQESNRQEKPQQGKSREYAKTSRKPKNRLVG